MANPTSQALLQSAGRTFVRGLAFTCVLSAFINVAFLVQPLFMIEVYSRVIPARSYDTLYGLLAIALFTLAIYGLLEFARAYTYQRMARRFAQRMNLPALQAAVTRAADGGAREATAAIRDISDLRQFIGGNAINTPFEAFWSIVFVAILYMLHPVFGHVSVVVIVVVTALNVLADRLTRRSIREANEAQARYIADVGGTLRHSEAIEGMGMLPALVRNWRGRQTLMLDLSETANVRSRAIVAFLRSFSIGSQISVLAVGAVLVLRGEIPTGSMFMAMMLSGRATQPFTALVETWRQWVTASSAWRRVQDLVAETSSVRQTMPLSTGDGDLVIDNLVFVAPGRDIAVLRGLSFQVSPGEVLGIVGPSGAGKSTLARALVGVVKPTAGGVYLDGNSTFLWERGSFGRAVGYLPQSLAVIEGTVRQFVARMEDGDPRLVVRAARAAGVHDLVGRLPHGYDTAIVDGGNMLSGGQMQRLALARALYGDPKLVILDEPNSNLDVDGERALVEAIEAARARGAIIVVIAHRPSVMGMADKILVLQEGRASRFGPRTEVMDAIAPDQRRAAPRGRAGIHSLPAARDDAS